MRNYRLTSAAAIALITLVPALIFAQVRGEFKKRGGDYMEIIDKTFKVGSGGTLYLDASTGSIQVSSWNKEEVRVIIEKRADVYTESEAKEIFEEFEVHITKEGKSIRVKAGPDRRWRSRYFDVHYEFKVPEKYNLALSTDAGSVTIGDIEGNVKAETSGGSIKVGYIKNGQLEVETAGGSIKIKGIENGDGFAETAGGSISVGDVTGKLKVETSGGSISIGRVGKEARAETAGGSISVDEGGANLIVSTSGGSIDIGKAGGNVDAETAGGSIRIGPSKGDVKAETAGGSIKIRESGGQVNAETAGGSITVEGSGGPVVVETAGGSIDVTGARGYIEAKTAGGSIEAELIVWDKSIDTHITLETAGGDLTVYLPEKLAASIDAELRIERRASRKYYIYSDFKDVKISEDGGRWGSKVITAQGDINGGGDPVKLRTVNGDIHIKKLR